MAPPKPNARPPPPQHWIQQHHVVLGDTSCRNTRTTRATKVLRQIKREARRKYFGQKKERWVPMAIQELQERLAQEYQLDSNQCEPNDEIGKVLIKCTPKTLSSGRVAEPYLYGFLGDTQAWYGIASKRVALEFFFTSRDGPQLETELVRHQENLDALGEQARYPVAQQFAETLCFFSKQVDLAEEGNELASKLLESLKPINALKEQWKMVRSQVDQNPSTTEVSVDSRATSPVSTEEPPSLHSASKSFAVVSLDDKQSSQEAMDTSVSDIGEPLVDPLFQLGELDSLDELDVDGFLADMESSPDRKLLELPQFVGKANAAEKTEVRRRTRSDSDCSSLCSAKPSSKKSRTMGSLHATAAALATLATIIAVRSTSQRVSVTPWLTEHHQPQADGGLASRYPTERVLHESDTEPFSEHDLEPFPWGSPEHEDDTKDGNVDDDWCKRDSQNPFASLAAVGEFLCSIDFTADDEGPLGL